MESIPKDFFYQVEHYDTVGRSAVRYITIEKYVKGDLMIILYIYDKEIISVEYLYQNKLLARYSSTGEFCISSVQYGSLNYNGYERYENPDYINTREQNVLIPPVWNHLDYCIKINNFFKHRILFSIKDECYIYDRGDCHCNFFVPVDIYFDMKTMRFYHKKDFVTFIGDSCLIFNEEGYEITHPLSKKTDWDTNIVEIIFPKMGDYINIIRTLLPQPIHEEIISHLFNPKE